LHAVIAFKATRASFITAEPKLKLALQKTVEEGLPNLVIAVIKDKVAREEL
jgi:hypothetical protein